MHYCCLLWLEADCACRQRLLRASWLSLVGIVAVLTRLRVAMRLIRNARADTRKRHAAPAASVQVHGARLPARRHVRPVVAFTRLVSCKNQYFRG